MGGQLNDVCDEGTDIYGQNDTYIRAPQISVYSRTDGSCMHGSQVNVVDCGVYIQSGVPASGSDGVGMLFVAMPEW